MSTDVMIYANDLSKSFGSFKAVDKISFEVRRGEVVGFLGPNGAGKSTTMRILTCFLAPTAGTARIKGFDVFDSSLDVRRSLGYLPQRAPLYLEMSVLEYLRFAADLRHLDQGTFNKRARSVVEVCGLAQVLGKERTVLLSTHNLAEVEAACGRAIIVSRGRIVADGAIEEIRAKSGKVRRYTIAIQEAVNGESYQGKGEPPKSAEVLAALKGVTGAKSVAVVPTDDKKTTTYELTTERSNDLRPELFRLIVDKGWVLLELHRDTQKLEDVFRDLTIGDERRNRVVGGGKGKKAAPAEPEEDEDDEEEDEDEENS